MSEQPVSYSRRDKYALVCLVTLIVVCLDQLTKTIALDRFRMPVEFGPVTFFVLFNRGAAFGLGQGYAPMLVAIGAIAFVIITITYQPVQTRLGRVAMGLVLGGAIGNMIDRFVRGHDGAVVDFIDFHWWPTFNVADAAIVCGVVLFVITTLFTPKDDQEITDGNDH